MMCIIATTSLLLSQVLFAKTYGGTSDEWVGTMVQTNDGGYAVAGQTKSFGTGMTDILVVKITGSGDLEWVRTFGGAENEIAWSIAPTTDGGLALAGATESFGVGYYEVLVLKLTGSGGIQWARTFGGTANDEARSIIQTSDGGYAIAGATYSFGAGNTDLIVLKLTSSGGLQWAKTFGEANSECGYSIIQTSDGGYAVAGYTQSFGAGNDDLLVLKLTSSGGLSWAKTFGGTNYEDAWSIIQTTDGGYAVGGVSSISGYNFLFMKLSSSGALEWARTFGRTNSEYVYSIIQTSDGGYAVAGSTQSFGTGGEDFLFMKLSSGGALEWARTFGGMADDQASSIIQTSDGGYAISGVTGSFGAGAWDFVALKTSSGGGYAGCVNDCSPTVMAPTLSSSSPTIGAACTPTPLSVNLTVGTPSLSTTDACPPAVEESDVLPGNRLTCSLFSGGIIFHSPADIGVRIYSADGRVAYSGQLQKGENRINLDQGVYLWIAGHYRGKAAVR